MNRTQRALAAGATLVSGAGAIFGLAAMTAETTPHTSEAAFQQHMLERVRETDPNLESLENPSAKRVGTCTVKLFVDAGINIKTFDAMFDSGDGLDYLKTVGYSPKQLRTMQLKLRNCIGGELTPSLPRQKTHDHEHDESE